jgi:hypothetical protein
MLFDGMAKTLTRKQIWAARTLAVVADSVQILLLPLFAGGAPEGPDTVLDLCMAVLMCSILGFHAALLPTILAEALPAVDLFPSWTLAVLYVTRKGAVDATPKLERGVES